MTAWIHRDFPSWEATTYDAARQMQDRLVLLDWFIALHRVVAIGGVVLCGVLLPIAWTRRPIVAWFIVLILLALPLNALITGRLSGLHDRYQSRVMWLPSLLAVLALPALQRRERRRAA